MFEAAVHGRLGNDPREIPTRSGTLMVVAPIAVKIQSGEDDETEWIGLVAFNRLAELLLRHKSGDMVSAAGRIQINTWSKNGEQHRQFQIVLDSLVSARTVRPGGGSRQQRPEPDSRGGQP